MSTIFQQRVLEALDVHRQTDTLGRHLVAETKLPGVFKIMEGEGFIVRARVPDPMTGALKEIRKVLDVRTEREAFNWLEDEKTKVLASTGSANAQRMHFADYAVSLMERKIQTRELRSPLAIQTWRHVLSHLIGGTSSQDGEYHVPGFGELALDEMRVGHIERWRTGIAELINRGEYSPRTINGWLKVLKVIFKQATREFELPRRLHEDVKNFDTVDHPTYTDENPNSLTPEQTKEFLALMMEYHPHHYAMAFLGLCTGLRPSTLRPIRWKGPNPDLLWDERKLLVRQSQTLGSEVLQTTKQRTRYKVHLPEAVIQVLRWHVDTQLTVLQQGSDLLFPSVTGTFRSACVLNKPFAEISEMMNLGFVFTQRGMRRAFNDLAREAQVNDLVTRSVSGHLTEEMQRHYSSVRGDEQEAGLAKVVNLMTVKARLSGDRSGDRPMEVVIK